MLTSHKHNEQHAKLWTLNAVLGLTEISGPCQTQASYSERKILSLEKKLCDHKYESVNVMLCLQCFIGCSSQRLGEF